MKQFKHSFFNIVIIFLITILVNPNAFSQSKMKTEKLEELFSKFVEYKDFNGSILVADEGNIIYKNGFGLANMELNVPNKPNTKHRLASVTKQFTAMLTMQLVVEGLIDLQSTINTYLPEYPNENGRVITIHHLLSHTSGIPNYTSFQSYREIMRIGKSPIEIIETFMDSTLHFKPGDQFDYSNSGYVLLGHIIEKVTGKTYAQVLQEKIFAPLKMNDSGYDQADVLIKNRSSGYYKNGRQFKNANYIDMSVAYSAGGIYSTVEDLFLWDQALYSEKLLPKEYLDMIFEKHIPAWGQSYGYGWIIGEMNIGNTKKKIQIIEHSGDINGYKSLVLKIPNKRSSILLLSNISGAPLYDMANAITGILFNESYDFPKKSLANSVANIIKKQGTTKAINYYNTNKNSKDYNLDENEINALGYELLQTGNITDALSIFKLNVQTFPGSSNAYDSYAEAQMLNGNNLKAIENYQKSIELNPRNDNGIKMLKELGVHTNQPTKHFFYFLETDSSWRKELFHFPIHFARDIDHKGLEDARFPIGWAVNDSETFWSYVFAWKIDKNSELSVGELEDGLEKYFDGLMRIEDRSEKDGVEKTIVDFEKTIHKNGISHFTGTVKTLEAFFNHKAMTLNVKAEQHLSNEKNELIIIYRFSPKSFESSVWQKLSEVKIRKN